jgi:hypothetical protein
LSSSYSDLVIASSFANDSHGSTLTLATYNPADATDYRKWVINQGNWGARKQFLDFGYSDANGRANPHLNINNTDTVLTLDGVNKRVGIGATSPGAKLEVNGDLKVFGGEIIGKIKASEEFAWSTGKPPVKMWPSATSVAFLTFITGAFNGFGENVEIVDKDGFWWLRGQAGSGTVAARARCIGAPPK